MRSRSLLAAFAAAALAAAGGRARAESTVIRDTRLEDLGLTPSLGRGFTPAISSLHSVCFDKMPTTPPSYDFDYSFEELDETSKQTFEEHRELHTAEIQDFIRENTHETTISDGTTVRHVHNLLAVLVVDSYYATIDESHAQLSADAIKLLSEGDVHGFFTGCGTHYIRSISRRSYFLTLFSYTSTATTRDRSFELVLEQEVRKFHAGGEPGQVEVDLEKKFGETARNHDLRVITRSIGLTARKDSSLLPFDVASYKESVKDAFKASQEDNAGRVVAMEIMPWLSNTQVLVTLNFAATGAEPDTWIERKRILSDNAEFYIELAAAIQQAQTQVHRAEACRRELDQNVLDDGKIKPRYAGAVVISHRDGARLPLTTLVDALSDANIDKMRAIGLAWRDGPDGKSGAGACMAELERTQLSGRYHNSIPSCTWQRVKLPNAGLIDEHCPLNIEEASGADDGSR